MGLSEEEQKEAHELRLQLSIGSEDKIAEGALQETDAADSIANATSTPGGGCCQGNDNGNGNFTCCQNGSSRDKIEINHADDRETENIAGKKARKICGKPTWFESWEREDTYAALAVVAAVASIAVAYSCYRQMR